MPVSGRVHGARDSQDGRAVPGAVCNLSTRCCLLGLLAGGLAITAWARAQAEPIYNLPSKSRFGRAAKNVLEYLEIPGTAIRSQ